jgi:hypothetical protein
VIQDAVAVCVFYPVGETVTVSVLEVNGYVILIEGIGAVIALDPVTDAVPIGVGGSRVCLSDVDAAVSIGVLDAVIETIAVGVAIRWGGLLAIVMAVTVDVF